MSPGSFGDHNQLFQLKCFGDPSLNFDGTKVWILGE